MTKTELEGIVYTLEACAKKLNSMAVVVENVPCSKANLSKLYNMASNAKTLAQSAEALAQTHRRKLDAGKTEEAAKTIDEMV